MYFQLDVWVTLLPLLPCLCPLGHLELHLWLFSRYNMGFPMAVLMPPWALVTQGRVCPPPFNVTLGKCRGGQYLFSLLFSSQSNTDSCTVQGARSPG